MQSKFVIRKITMMLSCIFCVLCFSNSSVSAFTDETSSSDIERQATSDAQRLLHNAVDRKFRLSKKGQSEIGIFGGDYLGDEWHNTWDVGFRYLYHINNTFAIGPSYMYSPIRANSSTSFGQSLTTDDTHTIDVELQVGNDCAFRAGKTIIDCDFYLTVGGGTIYINRKWNAAFIVGGGLKIYTPLPWFAVRFDVNSILHPTPIPSGDKFNADIVMNGGVSFLFPERMVKEEEK